jgi:hypothetical protein
MKETSKTLMLEKVKVQPTRQRLGVVMKSKKIMRSLAE